ncbi:hypothetical protein, partial [Alysiella crassa]|uniref:hypothetical protein n=1 Tax=Alysiella crassa TaxID=153491 RepID=UPI001B80A684
RRSDTCIRQNLWFRLKMSDTSIRPTKNLASLRNRVGIWVFQQYASNVPILRTKFNYFINFKAHNISRKPFQAA